jgi:hypothetical protein
MEWTFGSVLWPMVAVFAWTAAVLMLCYTLIDITRRHLPARAKATWIGLFMIMPILGPLAYVTLNAIRQRREGLSEQQRLALLGEGARRHEDGRLSAAQLDVLKRQALRY